jgi:sulfotransferase
MIAGLPRSGSTLLSAILNQNPKFYAGISDPLNDLISTAITSFSTPGLSTQCTEEQRVNVLRGIIESFYADRSDEVIFNTSRFWTSHMPLMHVLYPEAKVICCVRDIGWILDSFEQLYNKNPTINSKNMYGSGSIDVNNNNVYHRADAFMGKTGGTVRAYDSMKTAYYTEYNYKLLFVEYNDLASNPENTMRRVYDFIGEPYYNHDFSDVEVSYDEYDEAVQVKGLHKVRKKVEFVQRPTIIPPDIWERYSGLEFWRN